MTTLCGVIEFPNIRGSALPTWAYLGMLHVLGKTEQIVGWGIWQDINLALRDIGSRGAEVLSQELPFEWRGFTIRQSGKVRWSISRDNRTVVIWDLWNWVKRPPKQGETATDLYLAIKSAGDKMGVRPRGYFGNGNLASPLLRAHNVENSLSKGTGIDELASRAFFGGRIQSVRIGSHRGQVYEYDLNSAYAWGLSQLPEIVGIGTIGDHCPWRLVHVEWCIPRQKYPIYPFPVRSTDGKVEYPRIGEGWYWSPLVNQAEKHGAPFIRRLREIPLKVSGKMPFDFIDDLYSARRSMTNPLEKSVAKWTLSALWGKLCQIPHDKPERQSFRCLAWAGMATSLVNAELLRVAMMNPSGVWSFGVDSLITSEQIGDLTIGPNLGNWKLSQYQAIEAYQPGFWRCLRANGTWKEKSRGVPEGVFNWEEASKEWKKYGSFGRVPVSWEEFVGLSSSVEGFEDWLSTRNIENLVLLRPGGLKGLKDLQRAGAGGTRTWEPPDRVENTSDFREGYGLDHSADSAQEAL